MVNDIPAAVQPDVMPADRMLLEAARLIYVDPAYANENWESTAIVFDFVNGMQSMYGYIYRADDSWKSELPNGDEPMDQMLALQAAMEKQTGKKWHRALIHIWRDTGKMNVTFEYDDPKRWTISPANLEESVNALRP